MKHFMKYFALGACLVLPAIGFSQVGTPVTTVPDVFSTCCGGCSASTSCNGCYTACKACPDYAVPKCQQFCDLSSKCK